MRVTKKKNNDREHRVCQEDGYQRKVKDNSVKELKISVAEDGFESGKTFEILISTYFYGLKYRERRVCFNGVILWEDVMTCLERSRNKVTIKQIDIESSHCEQTLRPQIRLKETQTHFRKRDIWRWQCQGSVGSLVILQKIMQ